MTRNEKANAIEELKEILTGSQYFYIADSSTLTVEQVNRLRGLCHEKGVKMKVVKNTVARKAMESFDADQGFEGLYEALKGPTTLMFAESANVPAKIIKEFRGKEERPFVKAAYIDSDVFMGDQVDLLSSLKSKEELIGDIVLLLQSPIKNVVGSLQSAPNTLAGLVKALQERAE